MSNVFLVFENIGGIDEVVKVFSDRTKAELFAEALRAETNYYDVSIVEMAVQ